MAAVGTSTVVCDAGYTWANNALGQDPCTMAAKLTASCYGRDFTVIPLGNGEWYVNENKPAACACTTAYYSLYAACGDCQGNVWASWAEWSFRCSNTAVGYGTFTVPSDTRLPSWVMLDIRNTGYEPGVARNLAVSGDDNSTSLSFSNSLSGSATRSASASGAPSVSASNTFTSGFTHASSASSPGAPSSSRSSSHSPSTTSTSSSGSGSVPKDRNTAAIVGGAVGGVAVVIMMLGAALYSRRKNKPRQLVIADLLAEPNHPAATPQVTAALLAANTTPVMANRPMNTARVSSMAEDPQKSDATPPPYSDVPRL